MLPKARHFGLRPQCCRLIFDVLEILFSKAAQCRIFCRTSPAKLTFLKKLRTHQLPANKKPGYRRVFE
jgi:hypothetical protein